MKLCIGNWKMNCGLKHIKKFCKYGIYNEYKNVEVVIALPFPYLYCELQSYIVKSSQDVSIFDNGAHTGEVGAKMIKEFGAKYVIIGHSERRISETQESIILKINNALNYDLKVILCVGENTGENVFEKIKKQLDGIKLNENIIIAYEPVWAIGTGKAASISDVTSAINYIKKETNCIALYGGSVNNKNCVDFSPICDGFLVGNASLDADFFDIANSLDE